MSRFDWLSEYLARLEDEHVLVRSGNALALAPAHLLTLDGEDWARAGKIAQAMGCRFAGLWGDPEPERMIVRACLENGGDYLVLATALPRENPELASLTPIYPGADRLERHLHDLLGVSIPDHPDGRRWTRHQAWDEATFPLLPEFPLAGDSPKRTPADADYPFRRVQGSGVYEIPVGPVHAGIIEPGHFRFQAVGEEVLRLEQHLGYVHKGIEKLAVGRDAAGLIRLAARVSGDSAVAHAWAACQALERALDFDPPPRAHYLRGLLCERERVANHLGDIGAVCNDVGFAFAQVQCARLREQWQRRSHELFGHRLLMDTLVPGGIARDLEPDAVEPLRADHAALRRAVAPLFDIIDDHPSLEDRLLTTGHLDPDLARTLGCTGYVGKASGQGFDLRRDSPYPPYDAVPPELADENEGDVAARVRVRMNEVLSSLNLMDRLLDGLPTGPVVTDLPAAEPDSCGVGLVDGWRGEVLCYVRLEGDGRVARFFPRDPSWFTWPALEQLILGNIVPDFPVCNKSVNGSYSGQDL